MKLYQMVTNMMPVSAARVVAPVGWSRIAWNGVAVPTRVATAAAVVPSPTGAESEPGSRRSVGAAASELNPPATNP